MWPAGEKRASPLVAPDGSERRSDGADLDRGVSTAVGYVLILGVVSLLISTLFLSIGPFVAGQSEQTTRSSLEVVSNQLASDLQAVDRLASSAGDTGAVAFETSLPARVGGDQYRIDLLNVSEDDRYEVTLHSMTGDATATVTVRSQHSIVETTGLDGGPLVIEYDPGQGVLIVDER